MGVTGSSCWKARRLLVRVVLWSVWGRLVRLLGPFGGVFGALVGLVDDRLTRRLCRGFVGVLSTIICSLWLPAMQKNMCAPC